MWVLLYQIYAIIHSSLHEMQNTPMKPLPRTFNVSLLSENTNNEAYS